MLLESLLWSYSTLVTVLEAHVDNIKLPSVQQALLHDEQKINGKFGDVSIYIIIEWINDFCIVIVISITQTPYLTIQFGGKKYSTHDG